MTSSNSDHAKSFICEHTAEYTLVPNLKNILQERFSIVTPIFPWATREGSTLARHIHRGEKFQVIGLYPRRPKLLSTTGSIIIVKLNRQILLGAECGMKLGIPIVAGCPLVRDFWELGNKPNCLWIKLDQVAGFDYEIKIENKQKSNSDLQPFILNEDELSLYLEERSKVLSYADVLESFKEIKRASRELDYHHYFGVMGGYKPVYFLLR